MNSDEATTILHSKDAFAPVCYLHISKFHLEDKFLEEDHSKKEEATATTPAGGSAVGESLRVSDVQFNRFRCRGSRRGHFHISGVRVLAHSLQHETSAVEELSLALQKIEGSHLPTSNAFFPYLKLFSYIDQKQKFLERMNC